MIYFLFVVSIGVAFMLGTFYGRKLQAKAQAVADREAAGLRGSIQRVESILKEKP